MGRYRKFTSNYIKRGLHQHLKGGSSIFERDWVTLGGQLRFGPNKIPYYNSGNFIFTTSRIPTYKKKHRLGTIVGEFTYPDVKNASDDVNKVKPKVKTNDIRTFAYYGSAAELVRASVENIVKTFPGILTHKNSKFSLLKPDQTEFYFIDYAEVINNFGIDFIHKMDDEKTRYKYLRSSYKDYLLNDKPIVRYELIERNMFQYYCNDPDYENCLYKCYNNVKKQLTSNYLSLRIPSEGEPIDDILLVRETFTISAEDFPNYNDTQYDHTPIFIGITKNGTTVKSKGFTETDRHSGDENESFGITQNANFRITYDFVNKNLIFFDKNTNETKYTYHIDLTYNDRCNIYIYKEYAIKQRYQYIQMMTVGEHEGPDQSHQEDPNYDLRKWTGLGCNLRNWMPNTSFRKVCDNNYDTTTNDFKYVLYSQASHDTLDDIDTYLPNRNLPLYEVHLYTEEESENPDAKIYAYIYEGEVIYLTDYNYSDGTPIEERPEPFVIRPKDEIIENFFKSLDHFESLLLSRDTKPIYTATFITPFERIDKVFYYPRLYTWPSYSGYCIDVSSARFAEYIDSLMSMAEKMDEYWTDNIYRRMTHEAIRNYDWTYTREYIEGDEEANVLGGERMENVLRVVGRIFDDVKVYIDGMRNLNRVTYNSYNNIPNALLSEMLNNQGFSICSIIPHFYDCCTPRKLKTGDTYIDCATGEQMTAESDSTQDVLADCNCFEKHLTYGEVYIDGDDRNIKSADTEGDYWVYEDPKITEKDLYNKETGQGYVTNKTEENDYVWYPTVNIDRVTSSEIDIEFLKRLMLCAARILTTKGTKHCIEMMMGMFGYGLDEDFRITEYYREVKPRNYDENIDGHTESLGDMIVRINMNKRLTKYYDDDVSGIPVGSFTMNQYDENGNLIREEVTNRVIQDTYLIPFYTMDRDYDSDLYYQQNGGWGMDLTKQVIYSELQKNNLNSDLLKTGLEKVIVREFAKQAILENAGENITISGLTADSQENGMFKGTVTITVDDSEYSGTYDIRTDGLNLYYRNIVDTDAVWKRTSCLSEYGWTETLSYLHVTPDISSLLSININSINNGDIYYVCNMRDYMQYAEADDNNEIPRVNSNFFGLVDVFQCDSLSGWKNIDLNDENDIFYEKANYLNNLISFNDDNNPHVGYSEYDKGETFFDYMKEPFKGALEYSALDAEDVADAHNILFDVTDDIAVAENSNKIKIIADEVKKYKIIDNGGVLEEFTGDENTLKHDEHLYKEYDRKSIRELTKNKYYLNSKVMLLEIKKEIFENTRFYTYFTEVIMKYIMQLVPSTAILLLNTFETEEEQGT